MATAFGIPAPQPWLLAPAPQPAIQGPQPPAPTAVQRAMSVGGGNPGPTAPAASVTTTAPRPTTTSAYSAAAPAMAGLQAGQMGASAYDTKTGVVSALGSAATGAASGALMGSVVPGVGTAVGAAVGGGVGLVTGALNAWMSVGKENKANRDRRKLLAEAKAEQARRDKIARDDALDMLAFERNELKEAKQLQEWQRNRALIAEAQAKSKARADEFIARGYVT